MGPSRPYPRIAEAVGLLGLFLLLQVALTLPLAVVALVTGATLARPALLAAVNGATFGAVIAWGLSRSGAKLGEVVPLRPVRAFLFVPMTLSVLGLTVLLSDLDNLLRVVAPPPGFILDLFADLTSAREGLWGSILALVIVAPLTEEVLFRGLILRGFLANYPVGKAILVSSLLFGAVHLNPWQFANATVLGVLFGWWFVRTGSMIPCLFGHALNNALPLLLGPLLHLEIPGYSSRPGPEVVFQPLWLDLSGVLLAAWGHSAFSSRTQTRIGASEPRVEDGNRLGQ